MDDERRRGARRLEFAVELLRVVRGLADRSSGCDSRANSLVNPRRSCVARAGVRCETARPRRPRCGSQASPRGRATSAERRSDAVCESSATPCRDDPNFSNSSPPSTTGPRSSQRPPRRFFPCVDGARHADACERVELALRHADVPVRQRRCGCIVCISLTKPPAPSAARWKSSPRRVLFAVSRCCSAVSAATRSAAATSPPRRDTTASRISLTCRAASPTPESDAPRDAPSAPRYPPRAPCPPAR